MERIHKGIDGMVHSVLLSIPQIIIGILILLIGLLLVKILLKLIKKEINKKKIDISIQIYIYRIIHFGLYSLLLITVASTVGIPTTSFIAIFSALGLAVGLALQGSLSNFAGGVLILFFKPFKAGDYISTSSGTAGTVERIDILYTTLRASNGLSIYSPNGALANSIISNYTNITRRRFIFVVGISYDSNIKTAREVILKTLMDNGNILETPEPNIYVSNLNDSSVDITIRAWIKRENYWKTVYVLQEEVKVALDENNISIPFPQRDLHIVSDEKS